MGRIAPTLFVLAAAVALGALNASAKGAGGTGSIVVRLSADPSPPGVDWSYSVGGQTFQLGSSGSEKAVSGLADGSYPLVETTQAGQPRTLTALSCVDASGGTSVALASATANVQVTSGETVTCTFVHRALGPQPAASAAKLA